MIDSFWGGMARSTTSMGSLRFAAMCAVYIVLPLLSLPNSSADNESVFGGEENLLWL